MLAFQQQVYVIYHKYDHKLNWYVINIHVFAFKDLLFESVCSFIAILGQQNFP